MGPYDTPCVRMRKPVAALLAFDFVHVQSISRPMTPLNSHPVRDVPAPNHGTRRQHTEMQPSMSLGLYHSFFRHITAPVSNSKLPLLAQGCWLRRLADYFRHHCCSNLRGFSSDNLIVCVNVILNRTESAIESYLMAAIRTLEP